MSPETPHWSAPRRFGFRFAFCFLLPFVLCSANATVEGRIPWLGPKLEKLLAIPFALTSQALARHLFHLHGAAATLHFSGYGDRAIDWIWVGVELALAVVATLLWTALDRNRPNYTALAQWLRLTLRLARSAWQCWFTAR
jgi:hypothetical protein